MYKSYKIYKDAGVAHINEKIDQQKEMADQLWSDILNTPETLGDEAKSNEDVDLDLIRQTIRRLHGTIEYTTNSCQYDLKVEKRCSCPFV